MDTLFQIVNTELIQAADWFRANKLILNVEKRTVFRLDLQKKNSPSTCPNLCIDGTPIAKANSTKFLSVYVDQHLTLSEHIKNISPKIAKRIGILSRFSYLHPPHAHTTSCYTLMYLYTSLIVIWYGPQFTSQDPIV